MIRLVKILLISGLLSIACQNSSDNSNKQAASVRHACAVQRNGALTLCTEYQGLSGNNLTAIQSECELKGDSGYSWSIDGCAAAARVGSCALAVTAQRPVAATQYYFGPVFTAEVATGMCTANDGAFSKI